MSSAILGLWRARSKGAPERHFQSLIKTKDVCATCNNERLSALDTFAKNLGMHDDRSPADPKVFRGHREPLTRYLLKCGYNDARANLEKAKNAKLPTRESHALVREHRQFAAYILGTGPAPMPLDVIAGLLKSAPASALAEWN